MGYNQSARQYGMPIAWYQLRSRTGACQCALCCIQHGHPLYWPHLDVL